MESVPQPDLPRLQPVQVSCQVSVLLVSCQMSVLVSEDEEEEEEPVLVSEGPVLQQQCVLEGDLQPPGVLAGGILARPLMMMRWGWPHQVTQ